MRDMMITALAPMTWGTTYLIATELLPQDRPLLIAVLRALPIGLLIVAWTRQLPSGSWWWRIAVLGMLNIGLFFAFLFVAAARLPGGVAATLGAIQPLLVVLLAGPILGERPTLGRVAAAAMGILGVGLLVLTASARLDAPGITAALTGAAVMAIGTMLTKRWGRPVSPVVFTAWQLVAGGIFLVPIALFFEGPPPTLEPVHIAGFAYLGLVNTGLAYALWFRGIERFKASQVTFLALLSPVVAVIAGFLIRGQTLSGMQFIGILIVLVSIIAAQRAGQPARPNPQTTTETLASSNGGWRSSTPLLPPRIHRRET